MSSIQPWCPLSFAYTCTDLLSDIGDAIPDISDTAITNCYPDYHIFPAQGRLCADVLVHLAEEIDLACGSCKLITIDHK